MKHLNPLKRCGLVESWYDCEISAGSEWENVVDEYLSNFEVILLLISPHFVASEYCYSVEMKRAMKRHDVGEAHVIPIILRPVDWIDLPFGKLQCLPTGAKPITLWEDEDAALLDTVRGVKKVIGELIKNLSPISDLAIFRESTSCIFTVPHHRNPFFTGREYILKQLHDTFINKTSTIPLQALKGLGGVGKTQIAIEYAHRYYHEYQTILWIRADSLESLISDFVMIAGVLKLPEREEHGQSSVIDTVKQWLQYNAQWLLILDNVEDLSMISNFVPLIHSGHVLITTRLQATGTIANYVEVAKLPQDESALFLLRRSKIISVNTSPESISNARYHNAREIAELLDGLPLALDQAGAYIEETRTSLLSYLSTYRYQQRALLERRGKSTSAHDQSVMATFALCFEKIKQINNTSTEILYLCAFLHPDIIPEDIFLDKENNLVLDSQAKAATIFEFDAAIEELLKFSLVQRNSDARTLSIHRLVQAVIKDGMEKDMQRQQAERAIRIISRAFPEVTVATWPRCQQYYPQAQACATLITQKSITTPEASLLLLRAGTYAYERGLYTDAESLLLQALNIREQSLGLEHPDVADVLFPLAKLYNELGRYTQAESFLQRELAIRKQTLGSLHPSVGHSLNLLALIYYKLGKDSQAEPLYESALAIHEKELGPEHPETVSVINNLANLYYRLGKYSRAESLYLRCLHILEQTVEPEDPKIAGRLNNLALVYYRLGKYDQAEQLFLKAISIESRMLGPEHPTTVNTLVNLAELYQVQGKYDEAEQYSQRVLAIREEVLGPEHPRTAVALNILARSYYLQKKYDKVEPLCQRSLMITEKVLGPGHHHIADCLVTLVELYQVQGKYDEAEQCSQRVLTIREEVLGLEHPYTAVALNILARSYYLQKKYDKVESLCQQALMITERVLGPEHLQISDSLVILAELYRAQERYDEADLLYQRTIANYKKILVPEHPDVINVLEQYDDFLRKLRR
jgi:tetratricopeptide (TPR) repeat protein